MAPAVPVVDGTDATVEVGVVVAGVVGVPDSVVGAGALDVVDALVVVAVGDGETIAAGVVVLDDDVVVAAADPPDVVFDDAAGVGDSLGSPLANGSRGRLASSVLADTAVAALPVVPACALGRAEASAGAGVAAAVPAAGAPLSRRSGTAMMAISSAAATSHSLRWKRSRRSELIIIPRRWRWLRRKAQSAGRCSR